MSRQDSLKSPDAAADVETDMHRPPALDPAVSLAEYAASSVHAPEPVGRTLRALAERAFTGEAAFELGTGVRVYLDGGHPYYAERVGEAPLGERLVATGVLAEYQLRQGMIRVGDVEHLGRLFDRESTIDRDAVLAATELITDEVLSEMAPHDAAVGFTAYRHHRSGVHRWFVGPGRRAPLRPVEGVAQVDRSLFDALPEVTPAPRQTGAALPSPATSGDEPELIIEWDEPDPVGFGPPQLEPEPERPPIVDLTSDVDAAGEPRPLLLPPLPAPVVAAPPEPPVAPSTETAADLAATDDDSEPAEVRASFDVAPMSLESALAEIEQTPAEPVAEIEPEEPVVEPVPELLASEPVVEVEPVAEIEPEEPVVEPVPELLASEPVVEVEPVAEIEPEEPVVEAVPELLATEPVVEVEPVAEEPLTVPASEPEPVALEPELDGFTIQWPDGSQEATESIEAPVVDPIEAVAPVEPEPTAVPVTVGEQDTPLVLDAPADPPAAGEEPAVAPLLSATDATDATEDESSEPLEPVDFQMPALRLDHVPEPDAEVPDDVADAVRRALAAIERASVEPDVNPRLRIGAVDLPDFAMPKLLDRSVVDEPVEPSAPGAPNAPEIGGDVPVPAPVTPPVAGPESPATARPTRDAAAAATPSVIGEPLLDATPVAPSAPVPGAFAPPTADMSAEAVYARLAAEREAAALPEPGQATVVFVEPETEHEERKGALKRLIGSLRRR